MFQQLQGVVSSINSRETNGKFGPGFQFFIDVEVQGQTITISSNGKKANPAGKGSDGNWASITVGSEIHALYTVSACGNYNNSKASQITVLAAGQPAAPAQQPQRQPQRQSPAGNTTAAPSNKTLEIKAGRAVNVAAALVQAGIAVDVTAGLREAIRLEVLSDTYYSRIYEEEKAKLNHQPAAAQKAQVPVQPQRQTPVQQPQVPVQQPPVQQAPPANNYDDGFDDDIPF